MPARNSKKVTTQVKTAAKKKPKVYGPVVRRDDPKPDFDGTNLWYRNIRMVRLEERAGQKIALLEAFQKAGWPPRIAWPPHVNGDAVRMRARVRKLVSELNESIEQPGLVFHAAKNGVGWQASEPSAS